MNKWPKCSNTFIFLIVDVDNLDEELQREISSSSSRELKITNHKLDIKMFSLLHVNEKDIFQGEEYNAGTWIQKREECDY